jgi:UDP-glucuronate decarboxylase
LKKSDGKDVILVTGASGFVGNELFRRLKLQQRNVYGLTRVGPSSALRTLDQEINVLSVADWPKFVADLKPISIILCDWEGVALPKRDDREVQEANVSRWCKIIEASSPDLRQVLALGSQAELPKEQNGIKSDAQVAPRGIYGESKTKAYVELEKLAKERNFSISWVRIFSLYGDPKDHSWLLPKIIDAVKTNKPLALTPSTQNWNFLHVSDLVSAIISILDQPKLNGPINVANTETNTILEVVEYVARKTLTSALFKVGELPFPKDQVHNMRPDVSEILTTGWSPKVNLFDYLDEQIRKSVDD